MAKKKNTSVSVSQEDNVQAQNILEQYHQIAQNLKASTNQKQAEEALTEINTLPEGGQIALLKVLSKENHVDAANVLTAIYDLSPLKTVRKEAKRSLIRLEGARIYPDWEAPIDRSPLATLMQPVGNPPRFWKGIVTDSMDIGEVQLLLCWEQGEDYKEVRVIGFLLEFGHDGVKDAFSQLESKRSFEKYMAQMLASLNDDIGTKNCTLAQGRRLLLEALEINKKHGTNAHRDYRLNLSLIKQLILDAPDLEDDDEPLFDDNEEKPDLHDLSPTAVVSMFVEYHIAGNFGVSYDLLTQDSPLREGLSQEEWIKRRKDWEQTANPGLVEPNLIFEHEKPRSLLWLPSSVNTGSKENSIVVEAGWSAELDETPLGETLPELPKASAVYEETRRHWFWASYSLVKENDEWRLHSISDESLNAQQLSIDELEKKIKEIDDEVNEFTKAHPIDTAESIDRQEALSHIAGTGGQVMKTVYYTDALIKKVPLDRDLYVDAAQNAIAFGEYERSLVYLLHLKEHFPEAHASLLRQIAEVYQQLSKKLLEDDDDERSEHFDKLAEEALEESLTIQNNPEVHISLAELLLEDEERSAEAKEHFLQAKSLISNDPVEEAHIEMHLGQIATLEEDFEEARAHYQRSLDLQPERESSWYGLAETYEELGDTEKAITSYQRAIELAPDNPDYYYGLSELYAGNDQFEKGIEVLENGLEVNPNSLALNVYLASLYMGKGEFEMAEIFVKNVERINPESEVAQLMRLVMNTNASEQSLPPTPTRKFLRKKHQRE